jgi:transposase-like protein
MATRERRKFTPEFKREAVKLAEQLGGRALPWRGSWV